MRCSGLVDFVPDAPVRPPRSARGRTRRATRRRRPSRRRRTEMTLEILWFCLLAFFWTGYFVLEGFDFGVGMLLPVLGRSERDRHTMLESIGPVWDGNEVWLVIAGGGTFAAFPVWYATMFSGFYLALLAHPRPPDRPRALVRVAREGRGAQAGRSVWAWFNTIASFGVPFLWGIALASLLHGVPIGVRPDVRGRLGRPLQRVLDRRGHRPLPPLRPPRRGLPRRSARSATCAQRAARVARAAGAARRRRRRRLPRLDARRRG